MSRVGRGARTLGLTGKGWRRPGTWHCSAGSPPDADSRRWRPTRRIRWRPSCFRRAPAALPLAGGGTEHGGGRIEDGDLLVVEEDESPPDGSIVVVLLREGEEVTVKRLFREGEMLRLRPEAPPRVRGAGGTGGGGAGAGTRSLRITSSGEEVGRGIRG